MRKMARKHSSGQDDTPFLAMAILSNQILAEKPIAHSLAEEKDIESETCLTFQAESQPGRSMHFATGMGRED